MSYGKTFWAGSGGFLRFLDILWGYMEVFCSFLGFNWGFDILLGCCLGEFWGKHAEIFVLSMLESDNTFDVS